MRYPISKKQQSERGFTIVEVLVAITIFSIAVAGVITASAQGGINVNAARNRLTATYLAQEGVELMRAKRDSYVISASTYTAGWATFVADATAACTNVGPCDIDVSDTTTTVPGTSAAYGFRFITCASSSCVLSRDTSTSAFGYYAHGSGTPTMYTRRITVVPLPNMTAPNELEITSTVSWNEGTAAQSITVNESVFNWYGS